MPVVHVKIAGAGTDPAAVATLRGDHLPHGGAARQGRPARRRAGRGRPGGEPVARAAQVDAVIGAGSNAPERKSRFVAEAFALLRSALGPEPPEVGDVVPLCVCLVLFLASPSRGAARLR